MKKLSLKELNRLSPEAFKSTKKTPIVIVLDNVRSALNVGSAFRTADAFALEQIILCGITAQPPHREIQKTALGATDAVDWEYVEDTVTLSRKLKQQGIHVCAIEQAEDAVMLNDFTPEKGKTYAIIFGNEVKGVQQDVVSESDTVLEIPQFGTKHSLNISVSCGVVVWDLFSKM